MASVINIDFIPNPNPAKKDVLKLQFSFAAEDFYKDFCIEIKYQQGYKNLDIKSDGRLFIINAKESIQILEQEVKIYKQLQSSEQVKFIARIFSLSGRSTSKLFDL
ncbi:MAG: hypothetical protein ABI844_13230 [Saprospiraceae bacterium]